MGNITLSMPDNICKQMKLFSEIKWSEIARKAIIEKLELLQLTERLAQQNKLTEKDVEELSKKIKAAATKRALK